MSGQSPAQKLGGAFIVVMKIVLTCCEQVPVFLVAGQ
jgi:hypothetical protein